MRACVHSTWVEREPSRRRNCWLVDWRDLSTALGALVSVLCACQRPQYERARRQGALTVSFALCSHWEPFVLMCTHILLQLCDREGWRPSCGRLSSLPPWRLRCAASAASLGVRAVLSSRWRQQKSRCGRVCGARQCWRRYSPAAVLLRLWPSMCAATTGTPTGSTHPSCTTLQCTQRIQQQRQRRQQQLEQEQRPTPPCREQRCESLPLPPCCPRHMQCTLSSRSHTCLQAAIRMKRRLGQPPRTASPLLLRLQTAHASSTSLSFSARMQSLQLLGAHMSRCLLPCICTACVALVSSRQLPLHTLDPRTCLRTHGFAFVPRFGEQFAREYVATMGRYIHQPRLSSRKKQRIAGDVTQFFMPAVPLAAEQQQQAGSTAPASASAFTLASAATSAIAPPATSTERKRKRRIDGSGQSAQRTERAALPGAGEAWRSLRPKWHALVRRLAACAGLTEEQLDEYHVQDEKVMTCVHSGCIYTA